MPPVRTLVQDIDDLYVTTWYEMKSEIVDNVFKSMAVFNELTKKSRITPQVGGKWIDVPLEYGKQTNVVKFFAKDHDFTDEINAAKNVQILTTAQYFWRYVSATIYRSWKDDQENSGKYQLKDWVKTKLDNVEKTLKDVLETRMLQLNNPPVDLSIDGIPNFVRDDPNPAGSTHTVGEIPQGQGNNTWWNNKAMDFTGKDPAVDLIPSMRTMYNNCSNGQSDFPELLITTQEVHEFYEDETGEMHLIVNVSQGDPLFGSVVFKGKPIIWSEKCPAGHIYFLNFSYIKFVYDPRVWFDMTSWKEAQNSLDRVAQILIAGNFVCSNRSRQGVIHSITLS